MQKQIMGGDRLGAGKKMTVDLKTYERSTHDRGYMWRSSMAPGTLVPFMVQVGLPGDTFDIDLNAVVMTHPTLGPLFGSYKLQLDIFECPVRLYHSALMQNTTQLGNQMATVLLPQIQTAAIPVTTAANVYTNPDNIQINPSALLAYLGQRGWGFNNAGAANSRSMSGLPLLMYWEIYKNYYSNKQEMNGAYLKGNAGGSQNVTSITVQTVAIPFGGKTNIVQTIANGAWVINYGAGTAPPLNTILFYTSIGTIPASNIGSWTGGAAGPSSWNVVPGSTPVGIWIQGWDYLAPGQTPVVTTFSLTNIDTMKNIILQTAPTSRVSLGTGSGTPYNDCIDITQTPNVMQGLGIKTYQSDLFNNWIAISTWNNIATATNVTITGSQFSIDTLILSRKVYDLLNRIAISGGTYQDWINAAYTHEPYTICISPVYHGGLSKEVVFQQVISLAQNSGGNQPLGTLAGRGTMHSKHKGGKIRIKCQEISYIIGIVSLTPRIDYSQGNEWHTYAISTMNDFHKPGMDQIGFQDLITEQMAWWDTQSTAVGTWVQNSAGKQPAWMNYMTNYNKVLGNFADPFNEMFMTLCRRFQMSSTTGRITDLTTYIDPSHYNFTFAQTDLAAQNFWTQIAVDITWRGKISAKIMPNL